MPSAIFRCSSCGDEIEATWSAPDAPLERDEYHCDTCERLTEFRRMFTPVSIGRLLSAFDKARRI